MMYELIYLDENKQKVTQTLTADTDQKARIKAEKILQDKKYTEPEMYELGGLFA